MKKQKFSVGERGIMYGRKGKVILVVEDKSSNIDEIVFRNDIDQKLALGYSDHLTRLVKKKKPMSTQEVQQQINKVMGAHCDHIEEHLYHAKRYEKKPEPKRFAREWWLVLGKHDQWAFRKLEDAQSFSRGLHAGADNRVIKIREVLDETSAEKQSHEE